MVEINPPVPPELRSRVDVLLRQFPQHDAFMRAYRQLYAQWNAQRTQRRTPTSAATTPVRGRTPVRLPTRTLLQPHPLTLQSDPIEPFTPLSKQGLQALLTTYPSRMRLGLTSLMQPLDATPVAQTSLSAAATAGGTGGGGPAPSIFSASVLGKRQRQIINYAEMEGHEDIEGTSSSADDDNEDAPRRGPGRPSRASLHRRAAAAAAAASSGTSTPDKKAPTRTYLGELPPGNMVMVEPVRRTRHIYPPEAELCKSADTKVLLVPIRVEFDTETHRIRDCFLWNLNEKYVTPESFAHVFCDDLGLAPSYREQISTSIRVQIEELTGVAEVPLSTDEQIVESMESDLRVIINLDVQIQTLHLIDRIEWDLSSQLTPDLFARQLVSELGLCSEAVPLITHSIHEELLRAKKDCLEQGLVGQDPNANHGGRGAQKLEGIWRDLHEVSEWGPRVIELTPGEIERAESERERHTRRIRRGEGAPRQSIQGARGGRRGR